MPWLQMNVTKFCQPVAGITQENCEQSAGSHEHPVMAQMAHCKIMIYVALVEYSWNTKLRVQLGVMGASSVAGCTPGLREMQMQHHNYFTADVASCSL